MVTYRRRGTDGPPMGRRRRHPEESDLFRIERRGVPVRQCPSFAGTRERGCGGFVHADDARNRRRLSGRH